MHKITRARTTSEPAGLVIHGAAKYDFIVWLFTLGGERRMRERMLRLAQLRPGERVLDMGCGTGTLALLAKREVGPKGVVTGVDASPEMVARAREKAKRAGADVAFAEGAAQDLPLADGTVDVVIATLMLHHVPKKARVQVARGLKRVLTPEGRFLAVDFMKPAARDRSVWGRFHRHGAIDLTEFSAELEEAGLHVAASGPLGEKNMHYVVAAAGPPTQRDIGAAEAARPRRRAAIHGLIAAMLGLFVLALVALHAGAAASMPDLFSRLAAGPFWYVLAAGLVLAVIVKIGLVGLVHRLAGGFLTRWLDAREEGRE